MIRGATKNAGTLVLEKTKDEILHERILELREKIHSEEYLDSAIQRIAYVISTKLVENPEELKLREQ
ncbi:MAG: hypothetical protein IKX23_08625 [Treponema sp.]|nr:hypothetical protein [Treponema sp.]